MDRMVRANGVELWCEVLGDPSHPPVLLIMGLGAQGIAWPDELCALLVAGERCVIRYDARDTGKSTCVDFDEHPYTLTDMAEDASALLAGLGFASAHVVGASMGGMVAQELAIEHPDQVRSLVSLMSTCAMADPVTGEWPHDLPGPTPAMVAHVAGLTTNPPVTRDDRVAAAVELAHVVAGPAGRVDEAAVIAHTNRALDRAVDIAAADNHMRLFEHCRDRIELLRLLSVPTLVIQGTDDPFFRYEHGALTAKVIPGATLLAIEGMGHEVAYHQRELADAILEHTSREPSR